MTLRQEMEEAFHAGDQGQTKRRNVCMKHDDVTMHNDVIEIVLYISGKS